jgi:hypothetical protein
MTEKEEEEKDKEDIFKFLKEAFCIDGPIDFNSSEENDVLVAQLTKLGAHFIKLKDSERGTFFVCVTKIK